MLAVQARSGAGLNFHDFEPPRFVPDMPVAVLRRLEQHGFSDGQIARLKLRLFGQRAAVFVSRDGGDLNDIICEALRCQQGLRPDAPNMIFKYGDGAEEQVFVLDGHSSIDGLLEERRRFLAHLDKHPGLRELRERSQESCRYIERAYRELPYHFHVKLQEVPIGSRSPYVKEYHQAWLIAERLGDERAVAQIEQLGADERARAFPELRRPADKASVYRIVQAAREYLKSHDGSEAGSLD